MNEFLNFTIVGLVAGAAYAVAASGLVVTYATSGVFNIAHGAIGMMMAFVYWQLRAGWGWPTPLALAAVLLVIAPAFGALVEIALIRRVRDVSVAATLVVTIGLMVLLIGLVNTIWKPEARVFPTFFGGEGFNVGGVFVTWEQLITLSVAVAIAVGLRLLLHRTRLGVSMRAVVDNSSLVSLNGARPKRVGTYSWALGSSLAALAGILIAPDLQLSVLPLTLLVVDAYGAAVLGRLRSLPLTFAGALGIGLLQSYAVGYMPTSGVFGSTPMQGLQLSIPTVVLFGVLISTPARRVAAGDVALFRASTAPASLRSSVVAAGVFVVAAWALSGALPVGDVVRLGTAVALGVVLLSIVPLTGWGGQISLCQMTFAGLGAFAMAKTAAGGSPLGLLAAVGLGAVAGALIALPALRLRGLYLALATLAFATAMDNMFFPASPVFGFDGSLPVARPRLLGISLAGERAEVVFLAVVFALLAIGLLVLRRGPYGRVLAAMKDSEAACATLGLSLTKTKLAVFSLSAAIAALGGALYGGMVTVVGATDFNMLQSLPVLLVVVVAGATTTSGALAGGLGLAFSPLLTDVFPSVAEVTLIASGLAGLGLGAHPEGAIPALTGKLRRLAELR